MQLFFFELTLVDDLVKLKVLGQYKSMSSFTSSDAQPHPPDHQAHEPDWEIQSSSETDKIWSGLRGLRILGRRMTAEALGWRLLGDLHS